MNSVLTVLWRNRAETSVWWLFASPYYFLESGARRAIHCPTRPTRSNSFHRTPYYLLQVCHVSHLPGTIRPMRMELLCFNRLETRMRWPAHSQTAGPGSTCRPCLLCRVPLRLRCPMLRSVLRPPVSIRSRERRTSNHDWCRVRGTLEESSSR